MGYCSEGKGFYDAFLSYAHADDVAHNGWVGDFECYLKEKVEAELRRAPAVDDAAVQKFSVCRDKTGFPHNGPLTEVIDEKVRQSAFLFVFLGTGYLKSEYCLLELDIFRQATGGSIEDALQRTYVIVLDRAAVELLRGGDPEGLPAQRRRLWSTFRDVLQKAIRQENFLRDGGLLPVRSSTTNRFDDTFHEQCHPLVQEFTRKLIERRKTLSPRGLPRAPSPVVGKIFVGAVPPRLAKARDKLVCALGATSVEVVDYHELREEPHKLCERLAGARILIQPFDALPPLFKRSDPPGGHLALQKQLCDTYQASDLSTPGLEMLWWEPVPPATGSPDDVTPLDEYDAKFLDELPQARRRHCTASELAAEIHAPSSPPSVTARVWVEWEEDDEKKIWKAQQIVHTAFEKVCSEKKKEYHIDCSADIEFGYADWNMLEKELPERPDGVVIVINENKDDAAVYEQTRTISSLEDVAVKKMFPGIFYMRATGIFVPPGWSVVRFRAHDGDLRYDSDELTRFVEHLFDVLYHKYIEHQKGHLL